MASRDLYPQEILQVVLDKSCAKAQSSIPTLAILSVLAGGYIGFGYLAYLKVVSGIPHEWSGFATLLGAAVFPIALICILLGGGELVTSNMMIMSLGRLAGRISSKMLLRNWVIV
ncbi:formate/nitrite transporter family protein, partial [Neisseria sp. P0017.S010]